MMTTVNTLHGNSESAKRVNLKFPRGKKYFFSFFLVSEMMDANKTCDYHGPQYI